MVTIFEDEAWFKTHTNIGGSPPSVNPDREILVRIGSGNITIVDATGNANSGDAIGLEVSPVLRAVANLNFMAYMQVDGSFVADGTPRTLTEGYSLHVNNYNRDPNITIGKMYGLRVEPPNIGVTNIGARLDGNVGIGGDPQAPLHVFGDAAVAGTTQTGALVVNGGANIAGHISTTATLSFAAAATNGNESISVSVAGVSDGDVVAIGVPNALANHNATSSITAWAKNGGVTVRRCVVSADGSAPPSATVRLDIWKH